MRIAEYIDIPMTERAGGVRTYIESLASEIQRLGHDVIIVDGLQKPKLFSNRHIISVCKDADIHHIHEPSTSLLMYNIRRAVSGPTSIVVTFHAPISNRALEILYSLLAPVLYKKVRLIITTTKRNAKYLSSKGLPASIIPLWADEFFKPSVQNPQLREPYVLSVCAVDDFHKYKNFPMLSRLGKVLKKEFNITMVHAGIHDFNLPYVKHCGQVNRQRLLQLNQKAMALVLPSLEPGEGFGIVAAEALACATPVLVSTDCGISEFLSSYFVSPIESFENRMRSMIEDVISNPLFIMNKAYKESTKFSHENCRKTAELILSAAKRHA